MSVTPSVVSLEKLCDVLSEIKELKTIDLGSAYINIGHHSELGNIIAVSTSEDKAIILQI